MGFKDNTRSFLSFIYPNPAADKINLEFNSNPTEEVEVSVYDLPGSKLIGGKQNRNTPVSIDISALPSGMYLLSVENGKRKETFKFLKE